MQGLWAVAALCAGCGRIGFATEAIDAEPDALAPCTSFGPFAAPVRLAGPIEGPSDDWFPTPTPDELELYYYVQLTGTFDIAHATRATIADPFSAVTRVEELSSDAQDKGPTLTADLLDVILARDGSGTYDLFEARRSAVTAPFDPPVKISGLSTGANEIAPWLSADGLRLLYVSSSRIVESVRADRAAPWGPLMNHPELAVSSSEDAPTTSADGLELFFVSQPSSWDVYTARRATLTSPFGAPVLLPQLSSTRDELGLRLSVDGRHLYYNYDTLYGGNGNADIWVATRPCLAP